MGTTEPSGGSPTLVWQILECVIKSRKLMFSSYCIALAIYRDGGRYNKLGAQYLKFIRKRQIQVEDCVKFCGLLWKSWPL